MKKKGLLKTRKKHSEYSEKSRVLSFKFIDHSKVREKLKFLDFIDWIALPNAIRKPKTHQEFAELFGLSKDTLTDWKNLTGFWDEVKARRDILFRKYSSEILYGLVKVAKTGNPRAVELFVKLFEGYNDKVQFKEEPPLREFTIEEKEKMRRAFINAGLASLIKKDTSKD